MEYAWLRIGDLYHKNNQIDKTIETFEEAITIVPEKARLYGKLAVVYFNSGQYDKSYASAKSAEAEGANIDPALWAELRRLRGK